MERIASRRFELAHPTLDATVEHMLPYMPTEAIRPLARHRLQKVASWIPAALSNLLYFEYRAGNPNAPVDMILCVEDPGVEFLATRNWRPTGRDAGNTEPWERLEQWAARWHDPARRPSSVGVSHILWVEFDINDQVVVADGSQLPTPSVFVGFKADALCRSSTSDDIATALGGCAPIIDDATNARLRRALPAILNTLPDRAQVEYVGSMMSRPGSPLRICFNRFTWDTVWQFAAAIGCAEDPALRAAVRDVGSAGPGVVQIDVREDASPTLGLECMLDRRSQVFGALPNHQFFDSLIADGVIPVGTQDDLASWPGCSRALFAHQLWPSVLSRRVNHIKLVGKPGELPLAKVYLCGGHRFFAPVERRATSPS